jgi:hypothetical protein
LQLEDKVVENREAAHAEALQREDVLERDEEKLPEPVAEAVADAGVKVRGELLGAIRMLLDGQALAVNLLKLPEREARALEALQIAVEGRGELGQMVYACDRRDMLEQALAVLQPNLVRTDDQTARELQAQLEDLTSRVGELRDQLVNLEDAQDELVEGRGTGALAKEATDPADKPAAKPAAKPSDPDAPRPATTLTGPDRPEPAPPATTLTGPERRDGPPPATTLTGPDRPGPPPPATTLTGPDRPEPPPPPTTLTGPELPDEAAPASTLGAGDDGTDGADAGAVAAAKGKASWWRRPFG